MTRARALVVALAIVLLLEPALFGDQWVVGRDLLRQFYPRCDLLGDALARGELPRWNPWSFHGTPWWGPRAGGVLYPGYLLFGWLPLGPAMAWFIALHLVLAYLGMRRLAAADGPTGAAHAAGVAYALGGFVSAMFWALPYLVSAALLPWALVGARELGRSVGADRGRGRGGALLAGVVALDVLVGDPQGALLTGLLGLTVACVAAPPARRRAAVGWVVAAGALAVLASGVMLASIVHELPTTDRAAGGWEDARYGVFPIALLADALVPGVWGHTAQHLGGFWGAPRWGDELPWCGLGVGALGLAALGASWTRRRSAAWREALGWTLAGLALAAVDAGAPLGLRYPTKWLVITALGLARGVGLGWATLSAAPTRARRPLFALSLGCLTLAALAWAAGPRAGAWLEAQAGGVVVPGGAPARDALLAALLRAGVCAGLATALCWRPRSRRAFTAWGLGLLTLDLLTAAQPLPLYVPRDTLDAPPLVETLRAQADPPGAPVRYAPKQVFYDHPELDLMVFPLRDRYRVETLRPNLSYRHAIRSVRAFESVRPAALAELLRDPRFARLPLFERQARLDGQLVLLAPIDAPLDRDDVIAVLRPTPDDPPLVVARNPRCPPWAYVVHAESRWADSLRAARDAVLADAPPALVVGPEGTGGGLGAGVGTSRITAVDFTPERVTVEVDAAGPGWLVVREAFHPDWEATLDGEPALIARADLLYRAVWLARSGAHTVVFRYAPGWWAPGLGVSALGWLALLAWLAWARRGPPRERPATD